MVCLRCGLVGSRVLDGLPSVVVGLSGLRRIVVLEAVLAAFGFSLSWIGCRMDASQQKVVQYLGEARAS